MTTSVLARFDVAVGGSAQDRAEQRHRRIALATVAGLLSRGLAAVTLLVALPLAAARLDPQELGIWTLLVSSLALLGFVDLGIGNGLMTLLADAVGRGDPRRARRLVTTALVSLGSIAVAGGVLAAAVVPRVPWARVLNADVAQAPGVGAAVGVFVAAVLLGIPAGVGQRVHGAFQQGWASSSVSGAGSALALAAALAAWRADATLPWFVAAMLLPPVLVAASETAWVLARTHRDLRPSREAIDRRALGSLTRSGFLFFVLAAAGAVAYQTDALVVSRYLGAAEVAGFGACLRLFMLAPTALMALLLPIWPAYADALARGDHGWVDATLRRTLRTALLVSAAASGALLLAARPLLHVWSPDLPRPSGSLLAALAVWAVVSSVSVALAMYFNGANEIRLQVVASAVMAAANLALSIALVGRLGAAGPIWASVIAQTTCILVPELLVLRRRRSVGRPPGAQAKALA